MTISQRCGRNRKRKRQASGRRSAPDAFTVGARRQNELSPFDAAAERMRIARVVAGLTPEQAAKLLCKSPRTYLRWEAGNLDIWKIGLFGMAMNLSPDWLLMGDESKLDRKWFAQSKVRIMPVTLPWYRKRRDAAEGPGAA
jgi:transcriptional regulator with XRE-family HTH domain